ncbi:hypothetical protein DNTS_000530, partial [Danionella cerebrum]
MSTRKSSRNRFDGTGLGEDIDGEDGAPSRPSSVLWERHIEQSIFLDISDDDSLHFSDLQPDPFTVQLSGVSAAPESPQLTDNEELPESCETEEGTSESVESVTNDRTDPSNNRQRKKNISSAPFQDVPTSIKPVKLQDDANTSDEEHEELPYDGAPKTDMDLKSSPSKLVTLTPNSTIDRQSMQTEPWQSNLIFPSNHEPTEELASLLTTPPHITDFLLRHFSKEELMNSSRIIEAETLPEMSLMESIDETIQSKATQICKQEMEMFQNEQTEHGETHGQFEQATQDPNSSKVLGTTCISGAGWDGNAIESPEQNHNASSSDLAKSAAHKPKRYFSRTRSYSELKYGQGQVHYPLPDFSKVAPKVKIPKVHPTVKPFNQSSAMSRAQSSPGILGKTTSSCKSTADIISRVLDDSINTPENVFTDREVAHQLQAEYDRLLAKYTKTENLIGQIHASSKTEFSHQSFEPIESESETLTDGERLTSELKDIIGSFMEKVEEFKMCVATSLDVEDQQMVLKSMMEAQDHLERNYLTKREEHRALEMQNYRGLSRNTGRFDPDREVEGQIFRIGMHLEDIKEQIDRNVRHVLYLSSTSSSPSPPLHKEIPLLSPHPSLYEESAFSISDRLDIEEKRDEEVDEEHSADGLHFSFNQQCPSISNKTPEIACEEKECRLEALEEQRFKDVQAQASVKQQTLKSFAEKPRSSEASNSSGGHSPGRSPQPSTCKTQIFSHPDSDSGFGSFDLSRPNTGLSQTSPSAVSSVHSDDVISVATMSCSDSETTNSNMRTTISKVPGALHPTLNHREYTQLEIQTSGENRLHRPPKEDFPSLGGATTMQNHPIEGREEIQTRNKPQSESQCSCHNSEVILALQYEVSRLKRALEESLNHVNKRTDYLSVRSPLERKYKGSHNRATTSRRVKLSHFQTAEDRISSYRDVSKDGSSTQLSSSVSVHPFHKPLLQVNYGSCCSLPAGFKLRDQASDSAFSRRRSTQSDSALLPSNVYFQRMTPSTMRKRERTSREESIHNSLDKALKAAFLMKQTTDRMANALSVDLAKAQVQRELQGLHITLSVFTVTSKSMTVRWSGHTGASSYKITATPKNSPEPSVFAQFSASTVMGSVNSLSPNTVYRMRVEAMDNAVSVLSSAETEETTAPEVPFIDKAYSKHGNSIMVEFGLVSGATSYIIRAETEDGFFLETPVASSPGTVEGLLPYTQYTLSLMSVNKGGRSQPSLSVNAKTVVVAPVLNSTSPSSDTIVLNWDPVSHAVSYTLVMIMVGSDTRVKLNTTQTNTTFSGLEPGTTYCIKGNAWDPEGNPGDDITVCQITRPPVPGDVQVQLSPSRSIDLAVFWQSVRGADSYIAVSSTGQNCSSSDLYCIISPLSCGQNHTITVVAQNTAGPIPCPPDGVCIKELTKGNCSVRWSVVPWVDYYIAYIKSDDGFEENCNTTDTVCYFQCNCGYSYLSTVFAYNTAGSSPPGQTVNHTTIPCCPADVSVSLISTETLEISWSAVRGAELYETIAADGTEWIHCNDTAPVCALSDLTCDSLYSVVVRPCNEIQGCNNTCSMHTRQTAPCAPVLFNVTQLNASMVQVFWSSTNTHANTSVMAVGQTDQVTCSSSGTSCNLSVSCGSTYEVSAVASSAAGQSLPSYSLPLEIGPCCPEFLNVEQVTQSMTNVSWSSGIGAHSYISSLTSPRGHARCHSMETHCLLGCITCGTSYNVSLEAFSITGQKTECKYQGFSASSCCPSSVKLFQMANNTLRVFWRSSSSPGLYNYTADLYGTRANFTCSSTHGNNACDVSQVVCGEVYTVVVSPLTNDGSKVTFCPRKLYSVSCSGNNVGMGMYSHR